MIDSSSDSLADREHEHDSDRVLNAETRRALGRVARLVGVAVIGALTVIVALSLAAATAMLSMPWQVYVAVTALVALALPIAVPYAMLRVYGLAHRDIVFVGKQGYREITTEIVALSGTSGTSVAFLESADATTNSDEAGDPGSHNPVEGDPDGANPGFESGEPADENSIAHETADTTEPEP